MICTPANRDGGTTHRALLPLCSQGCLCRRTPFPAVSPNPLPAHGPLTINEDVNPLELLQRLVHGCRDGLGLPDVHGQRQALLPCGCHQLFRGLQGQKETRDSSWDSLLQQGLEPGLYQVSTKSGRSHVPVSTQQTVWAGEGCT